MIAAHEGSAVSYLHVHPHSNTLQLVATCKRKDKASSFFLFPVEGGRQNEFHIAYLGDENLSAENNLVSSSPATDKYLEARLGYIFNDDGPLFVRSDPDEEFFHFRFERPMASLEADPASEPQSILRNELFYINCPKRWILGRESYISMKRKDDEELLTSGCVRSKSSHSQKCFMLFSIEKFEPGGVRASTLTTPSTNQLSTIHSVPEVDESEFEVIDKPSSS